MKSTNKTKLGITLVGVLALILATAPTHAANLLVGGYTLSTYASGLPVDSAITGMSIDPVTRQIYYMGRSTISPGV